MSSKPETNDNLPPTSPTSTRGAGFAMKNGGKVLITLLFGAFACGAQGAMMPMDMGMGMGGMGGLGMPHMGHMDMHSMGMGGFGGMPNMDMHGFGGMPPMGMNMGMGMPSMSMGMPHMGMPSMGMPYNPMMPVGFKYKRGRKRGLFGLLGRHRGHYKPVYGYPGMGGMGMGMGFGAPMMPPMGMPF